MVNLHTHTYLCRHAQGAPEEYAAKAVQRGIDILGFSDHIPFPDDRFIGIRMYYSQLDEYLDKIEKARQAYPMVKILSGAECEYYTDIQDYYRKVLLEEKHMDYLIGSVHFYPYRGKARGFWDGFKMDREALLAYAESYIEMLKSGLFLFGAHPDTFGASIDCWDENCAECAEIICCTAAELDIPLEINTSGWLKAARNPEAMQPYPLPEFWAIAAKHNVKVVVNSDAHSPEVLDAYLDKGYRLAESLRLKIISFF